jgi:hypothetical protein
VTCQLGCLCSEHTWSPSGAAAAAAAAGLQVSAWRSFFSAVGDLSAWVPVQQQRLTTGSCSSMWVRLPAEKQLKQPRASINLVFIHGKTVRLCKLIGVGLGAVWCGGCFCCVQRKDRNDALHLVNCGAYVAGSNACQYLQT